jgi:hypothetical protein
MRLLKNEKGIALVMALILSLIALAITSALIYLITQGSMISGFQKRYQTAQEAAQGGIEFGSNEIINKTIGGTSSLSSLGTYGGMLSGNATDACFASKLTSPTSSWAVGCSSTLEPKDSPDFTLRLSGVAPQPNFNVFVKIVDSTGDISSGGSGNTDTSGLNLEGFGVVEGGGLVSPPAVPHIYRVEVQGERETNPDERANYSVLYTY